MAKHRRVRVLLWGVAAAAVVVAAPGWSSTTRTATVVRVIDGDTFVIDGGARIRVRNFDSPELRHWKCPEERALAREAREVARDLLNGRRVTLVVDGEDRYRRLVADVTIHRGPDEVDFTDRMVALGVGVHWDYGNEPQPKWCDETVASVGTDSPPTASDESEEAEPVLRRLANLLRSMFN